MKYNRQILIAALIIAPLVAALAIRSAVLGAKPVSGPSSASPLAGVIAQSIGSAESRKNLPQENKDFNIKNVSYFYNNEWAVATVKSTQENGDTVRIILQMTAGKYTVVLGPGSAFSRDAIDGLPPEVGDYLINEGIVYESGP